MVLKLKQITAILFIGILLFTSGFAATVNILYFNDYHGDFSPVKDKKAGLVKFTSFITDYKQKNPDTIVLAGGDNYQGSIISNLTFGAVINKMFKIIGLNASAVGNHEFDWGVKYFPRWEKTGDFVYLAANINNKSTEKPVTWLKPYAMFDVENIKIAVIGLATLDTVKTTLKENIKNLQFANPAKSAQKWIDYLNSGKAPEGKPDYIIALTHIPSKLEDNKIDDKEINDLVKNTKGLNLLLSGHSHKKVNGAINNTYVIQAGSKGNSVAEINISFNDKNKQVENFNAEIVDVLNSNPPVNKEAEELFKFYQEKMEQLNKKIIGVSTSDFSNMAEKFHMTQMGAFVCKAINKYAESQVTILNQWGIRNDLDKGKITYGKVYSILPFDNTIITMDIKGKDLREQLEHSITLQGGAIYGINADYYPNEQEGKRLQNIKLNDGTPLMEDKYYKLAVNNFMYTGGDGYSFNKAKNIDNTQLCLRDVFEKYITEKKKISPVDTDYIKIIE